MTFEIDRGYVAEKLKWLRKTFQWKSEALAAAAGVTAKTIENIEHARVTPQMLSLELLAKAMGFNVEVFRKSTPEEDARVRKDMIYAAKHTAVAPTVPVSTAKDFLDSFGQPNALYFDLSEVSKSDALRAAADFHDLVHDILDYWGEASMSERLTMAEQAAEQAGTMSGHGYLTHVGTFRFQQPLGKTKFTGTAAIVSLRKAQDSVGMQYAMVPLRPPMENAEGDRSELLQGLAAS